MVTPIASAFRGKNLKKTELELSLLKERLLESKHKHISVGGWTKTLASMDDIDNGIKIVGLLNSLTSFNIRVEGKILSLYFNDERMTDFTSIKNLSIREVFTPETTDIKEFLLDHPSTIIRKEYTHKYKVTVNSLRSDADGFIEWALKLPKIKLSSKKYKYGGHFYVADEKTLNMCRLYLSNKIQKVEELVTNDEI
jgi:hypothetical protein